MLVARGSHGEAIREGGLTLRDPRGTATRTIACVAHADELALGSGDVVILGVKTQDVAAAIANLGARVAVVCAQNGVAAEPLVAQRFARVIGMMTWIPALHLEPGVVDVHAVDPAGVFRLGRFPRGDDELADAVASDLASAGFDAAAVSDVMRWKHGKLLSNLGNVLDAFCVPDPALLGWFERAADEAAECLRAANIDFVPRRELFDEMRSRVNHRTTIEGVQRAGGSTWQSAARGLSTELPYLNGWICELGARVGVPTPINRAFLRLAALATGPRSMPIAQLDLD